MKRQNLRSRRKAKSHNSAMTLILYDVTSYALVLAFGLALGFSISWALRLVVPKCVPTDKTVDEFWWLILSCAILGIIAAAAFKWVCAMKRSGKISDRNRAVVRLILVMVILFEITMLGSICAVLREAELYQQFLVERGLDPMLAQTRYWVGFGALFSLIGGHAYGRVIMLLLDWKET